MTRSLWFSAACALLLASTIVASLWVGAAPIESDAVFRALWERVGFEAAGSPPWVDTVLFRIRLPRAVCAALVGGALAVTGCALQGLFRNPLADPGVLGVSSGAALAAVTCIYLGLAARFAWALPVAAFIGALVTGFGVYRIASVRGQTPLATLLLAGIAASTIAQAALALVLFLALEEFDVGRQIVFWSLGGVEGRGWSHAALIAPSTLLGAAVLVYHARDLDAMSLGETQAASVGVDVSALRTRVIAASAVLVGGAVSIAGVIGFVGLLIPHALRLVIGPRHRLLLIASLVIGAAFLVSGDLLARSVWAPKEMRLGIVTAALGGPFFLALLLAKKREGLL